MADTDVLGVRRGKGGRIKYWKMTLQTVNVYCFWLEKLQRF